MNIFYLSHDTHECAMFHCDKHVVKMILETAQLLCTAHHYHNNYKPTPFTNYLYKATHKNHPSAIWVRSDEYNYLWTYSLFNDLCREYERRFGKIHKTWIKLGYLLSIPPSNIHKGRFTKPPQCMPDEYKHKCTITAYRNYYMGDKRSFATWKNGKPSWFI